MHFALAADWNRDGADSWTNAVVIPGHKLLTCTLPKVGSTLWKRMALRILIVWEMGPDMGKVETWGQDVEL